MARTDTHTRSCTRCRIDDNARLFTSNRCGDVGRHVIGYRFRVRRLIRPTHGANVNCETVILAQQLSFTPRSNQSGHRRTDHKLSTNTVRAIYARSRRCFSRLSHTHTWRIYIPLMQTVGFCCPTNVRCKYGCRWRLLQERVFGSQTRGRG